MKSVENINEPQKKQKKNKSGAKKALKTIGVIGLVGAIAYGGYKAAGGEFNFLSGSKESKLASSLVAEYTEDGIFRAPESVVINRAYDIKFCDGESFADAITSSGVKYCEMFDEYYTEDGRDIAIITLEGEKLEVVDAIQVELDGVVIYMPPVGYELDGNKAIKTTKETLVKIVSKSSNGDYSSVAFEGAKDYEITNVEERETKTFAEMYDMVLIVDVPDNAVLVNNQCEGALNLVPKIR